MGTLAENLYKAYLLHPEDTEIKKAFLKAKQQEDLLESQAWKEASEVTPLQSIGNMATKGAETAIGMAPFIVGGMVNPLLGLGMGAADAYLGITPRINAGIEALRTGSEYQEPEQPSTAKTALNMALAASPIFKSIGGAGQLLSGVVKGITAGDIGANLALSGQSDLQKLGEQNPGLLQSLIQGVSGSSMPSVGIQGGDPASALMAAHLASTGTAETISSNPVTRYFSPGEGEVGRNTLAPVAPFARKIGENLPTFMGDLQNFNKLPYDILLGKEYSVAPGDSPFFRRIAENPSDISLPIQEGEIPSGAMAFVKDNVKRLLDRADTTEVNERKIIERTGVIEEMWRRGEKYNFVDENQQNIHTLDPAQMTLEDFKNAVLSHELAHAAGYSGESEAWNQGKLIKNPFKEQILRTPEDVLLRAQQESEPIRQLEWKPAATRDSELAQETRDAELQRQKEEFSKVKPENREDRFKRETQMRESLRSVLLRNLFGTRFLTGEEQKLIPEKTTLSPSETAHDREIQNIIDDAETTARNREVTNQINLVKKEAERSQRNIQRQNEMEAENIKRNKPWFDSFLAESTGEKYPALPEKSGGLTNFEIERMREENRKLFSTEEPKTETQKTKFTDKLFRKQKSIDENTLRTIQEQNKNLQTVREFKERIDSLRNKQIEARTPSEKKKIQSQINTAVDRMNKTTGAIKFAQGKEEKTNKPLNSWSDKITSGLKQASDIWERWLGGSGLDTMKTILQRSAEEAEKYNLPASKKIREKLSELERLQGESSQRQMNIVNIAKDTGIADILDELATKKPDTVLKSRWVDYAEGRLLPDNLSPLEQKTVKKIKEAYKKVEPLIQSDLDEGIPLQEEYARHTIRTDWLPHDIASDYPTFMRKELGNMIYSSIRDGKIGDPNNETQKQILSDPRLKEQLDNTLKIANQIREASFEEYQKTERDKARSEGKKYKQSSVIEKFESALHSLIDNESARRLNIMESDFEKEAEKIRNPKLPSYLQERILPSYGEAQEQNIFTLEPKTWQMMMKHHPALPLRKWVAENLKTGGDLHQAMSMVDVDGKPAFQDFAGIAESFLKEDMFGGQRSKGQESIISKAWDKLFGTNLKEQSQPHLQAISELKNHLYQVGMRRPSFIPLQTTDMFIKGSMVMEPKQFTDIVPKFFIRTMGEAIEKGLSSNYKETPFFKFISDNVAGIQKHEIVNKLIGSTRKNSPGEKGLLQKYGGKAYEKGHEAWNKIGKFFEAQEKANVAGLFGAIFENNLRQKFGTPKAGYLIDDYLNGKIKFASKAEEQSFINNSRTEALRTQGLRAGYMGQSVGQTKIKQALGGIHPLVESLGDMAFMYTSYPASVINILLKATYNKSLNINTPEGKRAYNDLVTKSFEIGKPFLMLSTLSLLAFGPKLLYKKGDKTKFSDIVRTAISELSFGGSSIPGRMAGDISELLQGKASSVKSMASMFVPGVKAGREIKSFWENLNNGKDKDNR